MLTGISPNEYLRNRKLSMAGQELILSDEKIIDIAYKYGYESPESFSRAFSRFHGITPNAAKQSGMSLKFFDRLVIKIKLEGGTAMNYKIVKKEGFQLLTKVKSFRNEVSSEEGNTEIPEFWNQCTDNGVFDILHQYANNPDIFGVCAPISKESSHFDYGIDVLYDGDEVPEGFRIWTVNPTLWAVFPCNKPGGDGIGETWERIFQEFLPGSLYNMSDDTDLEIYYENGTTEIWIPVTKKTS